MTEQTPREKLEEAVNTWGLFSINLTTEVGIRGDNLAVAAIEYRDWSEGRVKELEAEIERYKKNENDLETLIRLDLETEFSVEAERFDKDCKKALWRLADSMDFPWADGEEYTAVEIEEWLEEYIRGLGMAIESKIEKLNGKEVDDGK